eukprot:813658-Pelagomonas_calceolata.AAC.1
MHDELRGTDKANSNTLKPNLISIGLVVKQPGHHGDQGLQAVGAHSPEVQVREARVNGQICHAAAWHVPKRAI